MPIIQTKYTADPAPYVHNDTVYLYTTHDEDGAAGFNMKDWLLYTSTDMVNWQDRGAVASLKDFKWFEGDNGAWAEQVVERNGNYYLAFASTCCPEGIGYAMSKKPLGPWEYKGHIMDHTPRTRGNHPGIIDYKGKSYCFGLNYDIFRLKESRHAEQRSVSVAEMTYNADGTIQQLPYFQDCKLKQAEWFNPYRQVEAETMAWGYGLKTEPKNPWAQHNKWNQVVTHIDEGKYILLKGVDFKKGARKFEVSASAHLYGGSIEIRLDAVDGKCIGAVNIANTKDEYKTFWTQVKRVMGVHDLYFVFKGGDVQKQNLFFLDWWKFSE